MKIVSEGFSGKTYFYTIAPRLQRLARRAVDTRARGLDLKIVITMSKLGGNGDRFGDYLCVHCANLLCISGGNQFTNTKFTGPDTQISKSNYEKLHRSRGVEGNFIKWSHLMRDWEWANMKSVEIGADEFFERRSETVVFPGLRTFEASRALCKKFHGSAVVIKNKAQSDHLNQQWWDTVGGPMGVSSYGKCTGSSNWI